MNPGRSDKPSGCGLRSRNKFFYGIKYQNRWKWRDSYGRELKKYLKCFEKYW